jgi:hypothetical protein
MFLKAHYVLKSWWIKPFFDHNYLYFKILKAALPKPQNTAGTIVSSFTTKI